MNPYRPIIIALLGILLGLVLVLWSMATVLGQSPKPEPPKIIIAGGTWGKEWMSVERADTKAAQQRGFDPSYTYILCDYKPRIKKLANGRWLIQFHSEITEEDEGIP